MLEVHIYAYEVYFSKNYSCAAAALMSKMTKTYAQFNAVWQFKAVQCVYFTDEALIRKNQDFKDENKAARDKLAPKVAIFLHRPFATHDQYFRRCGRRAAPDDGSPADA